MQAFLHPIFYSKGHFIVFTIDDSTIDDCNLLDYNTMEHVFDIFGKRQT